MVFVYAKDAVLGHWRIPLGVVFSLVGDVTGVPRTLFEFVILVLLVDLGGVLGTVEFSKKRHDPG